MKYLILLILTLNVFSQSRLKIYDHPNRDYQKCLNLETNAQSKGITLNVGEYKGACFNDEMMRAVDKLELPEHLSEKDFLLVENFSHKGKYYYALIEVGAIDSRTEVMMQLERFAPTWIAGHTQLRYRFPEKIVHLYETLDDLDAGKEPDVKLQDIVTSIEAMRPFGRNYGLVAGTQDKFLAVFRMKSVRDVADKAIRNNNDKIEQFIIKFEKQRNKRVLLEHYVSKGTEHGYSLIYNTLVFNCTNGLYIQAEPIVKSVGKKVKFFQKVKLALPVFASGALERSDLIEKRIENFDARLFVFREEMNARRELDQKIINILPELSEVKEVERSSKCSENQYRHHGVCVLKK